MVEALFAARDVCTPTESYVDDTSESESESESESGSEITISVPHGYASGGLIVLFWLNSYSTHLRSNFMSVGKTSHSILEQIYDMYMQTKIPSSFCCFPKIDIALGKPSS